MENYDINAKVMKDKEFGMSLMMIVSASQFHGYLPFLGACLA